jgi:hypothetical protein
LLLDNGLEGVLQEKARGLAYIEWLKDIKILLRGLEGRGIDNPEILHIVIDFARLWP